MRFLLILTIGLFLQTASFAQIDSKQMQEELEKMTQEMQEQLKNFNFENFPLDTAILKNFKFPEGFSPESFIMPNDLDMNEMMKIMERQMSQLDIEGMTKMMEENLNKIDFAEIEKMFEPFTNGGAFTIPAPEELEEDGNDQATPKKEQKEKTKRKKKKKSYKM